MRSAILYLKEIFDEQIYVREYKFLHELPMYLADKYELLTLKMEHNSKRYILVKPKGEMEIRIEMLKKQMQQIEKYTECLPIFVFETLRLSQRNALIKSMIPFIVPFYQLFIPEVVLNITEKEIKEKRYSNTFTTSTQLLFAYLFLKGAPVINAHQLQEKTLLSVSTINRSLTELVDRGLLKTEGNGTRKKYTMIPRKQYWEKGKEFLFNPVARTRYVKTSFSQHEMLMSNEMALARLSVTLNPSRVWSYATSQDIFDKVPKEMILNEYDIFDYDYYEIEIFKYNPYVLAKGRLYIDVVSLYAQFKDDTDERIQMALEELLEEVL